MPELLKEVLIAVIAKVGPELVMGLCCSRLPRERALAVLEAEYSAAEEAARKLETEKFSKGERA